MIFIKRLKNSIQIKNVKTVFNNMIPDTLSNKKLNSIVAGTFIGGRNLNISFVFITQSFFPVVKIIRLNSTHFIISSDIDFKDFINLYKKCPVKLFFYLLMLFLYQIILYVSERIF